MKHLYSFTFGLLILTNAVVAQSVRLAYFGETITHYGIKTAFEYPLLSFVKQRNQARKMLLAAPSVSVYRHPHNHFGVILSPELVYRRIGRRGGLFEASIAPAYFRYFLDGTTYEVAQNGELERIKMAGRNAFLPTVSLGTGKAFTLHHLPLMWYSRLNIMQQRPYNTSVLTRFSVELGLIYSLKKS